MTTMPAMMMATMTAMVHVAIHVAILILADGHSAAGRDQRCSRQNQTCEAGGRHENYFWK
jgi:hypothetical protein